MSIMLGSLSAITALGLLPFDLNALTWARWPLIAVGALLFVHLVRRRTKMTLPQLAIEVLIVTVAYFAYFLGRGFVQGREAEAIARSIRIIEFEQTAKIFWEPTFQEHILGFDLLVDLANWTYIWGHWPVIVFAALWLFMLHRDVYPVYRNAFVISGAIGLMIFMLFPVAPPRFLDAWGFVDTVGDRSQAYRVLQPPAFVNQYAAMPSLHLGWNLLIGVALVRHSSGAIPKVLGVVMPVVTFLGILLTANHYIVDGLAGATLALLGLLLAFLLHGALQRRAAAVPAAPA